MLLSQTSSHLSLREKVPFNPVPLCEVSERQYVPAVTGDETADLYKAAFIHFETLNFYFQFKV